MMFDSFVAVVPAVLVLIGGFAAMTAEAFRRPGEQVPVAAWSMLMLAAAGVSSVFLWNRGATSFGVVSADNFSLYVNVVLVLVGLLTVAFSSAVVGRDGLPAGEYYALTQFAIGGMMLMASAVDLLVIFLALEVVSLAVYVLTAIRRESAAGTEAAFNRSCSARSRARSCCTAWPSPADSWEHAPRSDRRGHVGPGGRRGAAGMGRRGTAAGRVRIQGLGRAVPHVDARCLRRGAGGRVRVHVHGRQDGGVRGPGPRAAVGVRGARARTSQRA
jgi:hypothetical protein